MLQIGQKRTSFDQPLAFLEACHRRIERFIAVIVRVSTERRTAPLDDEYAEALAAALDFFGSNARKHEADEEASLFPRMREAEDERIRAVVERVDSIEGEHRELSALHERVEALARPWVTARRADESVIDEIRALATDLEARYAAHIAVEDEEIFAAAAHLPKAVLARIGREMAARRGIGG
jgi:hemerythrin-like domain-containing protein